MHALSHTCTRALACARRPRRACDFAVADSALVDSTRLYFGRFVDTPLAVAAQARARPSPDNSPRAQEAARRRRAAEEKSLFNHFYQTARSPRGTFGKASPYYPVPSGLASYTAYVPPSGGGGGAPVVKPDITMRSTHLNEFGASFHAATSGAYPAYPDMLAQAGQQYAIKPVAPSPAQYRRAIGDGAAKAAMPAPLPSPRPWI